MYRVFGRIMQHHIIKIAKQKKKRKRKCNSVAMIFFACDLLNEANQKMNLSWHIHTYEWITE